MQLLPTIKHLNLQKGHHIENAYKFYFLIKYTINKLQELRMLINLGNGNINPNEEIHS